MQFCMSPFASIYCTFCAVFTPSFPIHHMQICPHFAPKWSVIAHIQAKHLSVARDPSSEFTLNLRRTKLFTSIWAHVPAGCFLSFLLLTLSPFLRRAGRWLVRLMLKGSMWHPASPQHGFQRASSLHVRLPRWHLKTPKPGWEWSHFKLTINTYVELHWSKVGDWLSKCLLKDLLFYIKRTLPHIPDLNLFSVVCPMTVKSSNVSPSIQCFIVLHIVLLQNKCTVVLISLTLQVREEVYYPTGPCDIQSAGTNNGLQDTVLIHTRSSSNKEDRTTNSWPTDIQLELMRHLMVQALLLNRLPLTSHYWINLKLLEQTQDTEAKNGSQGDFKPQISS